MSHLIFFCVLTTQAIYTALINATPENYQLAYPLYISILAFFCAPIQGGLSDYYCRKKSLIFAMFANLCSAILFVFWISSNKTFYLISSILLFGMAGNVNPIAISTFKDLSKKFVNFRLFICVSLFYFYCGDFFPTLSKYFISSKIILEISFILLIIVIILISIMFKDIKDDKNIDIKQIELKQRPLILHEIKYIYHNFLKHKVFILCFFGYYFIELSTDQFLFRTEVFKNYIIEYIPLEILIGTILTMLLLKFTKYDDEKLFIFGLILSFISFISLLGIQLFKTPSLLSISLIMIFLGFSSSLVYSCIYCLLTRKRHHHDYGKIFGLLESLDSLSYISAITLVFAMPVISEKAIYFISLNLFIVGAIFLSFFLHHEKKAPVLSDIP